MHGRNGQDLRSFFPHLGSYLPLGIARRGVARFSQLREENSRPASATRGLTDGAQ